MLTYRTHSALRLWVVAASIVVMTIQPLSACLSCGSARRCRSTSYVSSGCWSTSACESGSYYGGYCSSSVSYDWAPSYAGSWGGECVTSSSGWDCGTSCGTLSRGCRRCGAWRSSRLSRCGAASCGCATVASYCGSSCGSYVSSDFSSTCDSGGCGDSSSADCSSCASYSVDSGAIVEGSSDVYASSGIVVEGSTGCASGGCGVETMYEGTVSSGEVISESPMGETIMEGGVISEGAPAMESAAPTHAAPSDSGTAKPAPAPTTATPAETKPDVAPSAAPSEEASSGSDVTSEPSSDDLFDTPSTETPAGGGTDEPAETPAEEDSDADVDNLFGASDRGRSITVESMSLTERHWKDNTGRFGTVGRLAAIGESSIRIAKSNGRSCTVPFSRLSDADYSYVQTQAQAVGVKLPIRIAGRNAATLPE